MNRPRLRCLLAASAAILWLASRAGAADKTASELWTNLLAGRSRRLLLSGTSLSNLAHSPWPDSLKAAIDSLVGPGLLDLRNISPAGGNTSRVGPNCADSLDSLVAFVPDAVFLEFASNDATNHYDCTVDTCSRVAHVQMIEAIQRALPACEIFLYITGLPWDFLDCGSTPCAYCTVFQAQYCRRSARPSSNEHVEAFFDMVRQLADRYHTHLIDTYWAFKAQHDTAFGSYVNYLYDGHHPTPLASREIIVPLMLQALRGRPLALTAPATGDTLHVGDSLRVAWQYNPDSVTIVDVDISPDAGDSWLTLNRQSIPAPAGGASFVLPAQIGPNALTTDQVLVRVRGYDSPIEDLVGPLVVLPVSAVRPSPAPQTGASWKGPQRLLQVRHGALAVGSGRKRFDIRGRALAAEVMR